MAIVYRVGGSELTNQQIDDNFKYLESDAVSKGDAYEVVEADGNNVLLVDPAGGAFTIALDAAADFVDGSSFRVTIVNIGATGTVTIDPTGAETINGSATLVLSAQYDTATLQCDGSNWIKVSGSTAGSSTFSTDITFNNDIKVGEIAYFDDTVDQTTDDALQTITWQSGNKQELTLDHDITTMTFTDPLGPCNLMLRVVQGAAGSKNITGYTSSGGGSFYWPSGSTPTITATASAIDIIAFYFDGTNYYGVATQDFQT